jgi:TRAP-type C4-dicarboxylate transport system substrate-binding protein
LLLPWEVIPAFKLHEMTRFHTQTDPSRPALYSAGFIFAMNQAKYDSLPADLKKVIDNNSGAALSRQIGKIWDESQAVGRKAAQDRGNTIITLSAAETDNWIKASAPIYDEWVADMDKRGLNGKACCRTHASCWPSTASEPPGPGQPLQRRPRAGVVFRSP